MLKILYLEDSEIDAKLIRRALQADGIEAACTVVITRSDFEAALVGFDFDLVFADYRLPGFDAMQALELLQARKIEVPFILISGAIGEERAAEVLKAGVTDYILKDHLARLGPAVMRALEEEKKKQHQKKIEKEINRYTQIWSDAETLGKMGAFRWSRHDDIIYWTPGMYRIFEVDADLFQPTVSNVLEKIHPDDRENILRVSNLEPENVSSIFRIQPQRGGLKYLQTQGKFSSSHVNGEIESVQGIVQDVTVQYMAEEAVRLLNEELEEKVQHRTKELEELNFSLKHEVEGHKRTERLLRHSEEKYRLIADYSSDLVALHGIKGEILHASPSSEEILGYHPI
ncbi:MAG: PAS domain S-box protein, partial [Bacteroidota bacterium]